MTNFSIDTLENHYRFLMGGALIGSGLRDLSLKPTHFELPDSSKNHPLIKSLSFIAKGCLGTLVGCFGAGLVYASLSDSNAPLRGKAITPFLVAFSSGDIVAKISQKLLDKKITSLSKTNQKRITTAQKYLKSAWAVAKVVTGVYFIATNIEPIRHFANGDISRSEMATSTVSSALGGDIIKFDPKDPRDKFLFLNHVNTVEIHSVAVPILKDLDSVYDVKYAVVKDGYDIAEQICEATDAGKVKGIMLTIHGNPSWLDIDGPFLREGLATANDCFKKIETNVPFILNSCEAGKNDDSPALYMAATTGMKVIATSAKSLGYPSFPTLNPLSAEFTSAFIPWEITTKTFENNFMRVTDYAFSIDQPRSPWQELPYRAYSLFNGTPLSNVITCLNRSASFPETINRIHQLFKMFASV